jgi:Rrf2 family protein
MGAGFNQRSEFPLRRSSIHCSAIYALGDNKMEKSSSSMQLTRAADYAVRVMIHLASLEENERAMLPALAEATGAPSSFLSKVLQALTRAELISSRRGPLGGFDILARGRQASVREVIEAIDGPIMLNVCLTHGQSCNRKSWCPAHPVWVMAQRAMLDVLDVSIIADLAMSASAPSSS